jgi:serine/threonine protein kinase
VAGRPGEAPVERISIRSNEPHPASKAAELYLNEARIVAQLDHPNIVPVHDAGRMESGERYVVSKFIEGADLVATTLEYREIVKNFMHLAVLVVLLAFIVLFVLWAAKLLSH